MTTQHHGEQLHLAFEGSDDWRGPFSDGWWICAVGPRLNWIFDPHLGRAAGCGMFLSQQAISSLVRSHEWPSLPSEGITYGG